MRLLIIGEAFQAHLFSLIQISERLQYDLLFLKELDVRKLKSSDVIVIESSKINQIPDGARNLVFSVKNTPDYECQLQNEICTNFCSLTDIEKYINKENCIPVMTDAASQHIYRMADKIAGSSTPVLIIGAKGTGKHTLARYIHSKSKRVLLLNIDCNDKNIVFSSQYFQSIFKEAIGGTIYLQNICNLSLDSQEALFSVMKNNRNVKGSARIIAGSTQWLHLEVANGNFLKELFFELNAISLHVPPLNSRPADIIPLANLFCEKYSHGLRTLSSNYLSNLEKRKWPGNVLELKNFVKRTVRNDDNMVVNSPLNHSMMEE